MTFFSRIFVVAAVLGLSVCASRSLLAQAPEQPSPSEERAAEAEDHFQRDKATLADQAHRSVDAANANIDALKDMAKNEKGDIKREHRDLASRLSMLKDHVHTDIDKMDKARFNDWDGLRPVVERDVSALNDQLRHASSVTQVPFPADEMP